MKITASQLRKIIKEELETVATLEESLTVTDADNGKKYLVTVEEGPMPYTVSLTFGPSFSILLHAEEAAALVQEIQNSIVPL